MKGQEEKKTILSQLQEIADEFCNNFCKYRDKQEEVEFEESQKIFDEICVKKCPLNLLK